MEVSLIVAAAENDVIGNAGDIPWRLSDDWKYFKQTTLGHPVIMGRTTHEGIGKPLPGRQNIVLTRDETYEAAGCTVAHSIEEALQLAEDTSEVFIMGGGKIYEQSMPIATKLYLTRVHANPEGDTFFRFDPHEWELVSQEAHKADDRNQYDFTYEVYKRRA